MRQYLHEIGELLAGCRRELATAFMLCLASAGADMVCMILLPVFLFVTLAGPVDVPARLPFGALLTQWLPGYRDLALAVITAFLARGAMSLYVGARLTRLSESIRANLIRKLTRFYLTCAYQVFAGRSVASAMTMVGSYTSTFAGSVALPGLRLLLDGVTLVAILAFLVVLDYRVVGVTTLALALVGATYYLTVRRIAERQSRLLAELQDSFSQHMSRSLHSPREVRVFQLHGHFLAGMEGVLARGARAQARLTVIGSLPRALGELTLIGLALAYLAYRTHAGTNSTLLMSQLGLLGLAGLRLLPTFAQLLSNISALRAGRHVTGLLAKELQLLPPSRDPGAAPPSPAVEPFETLELRDVSFAYSGTGRPVLDGVSLTLRRGESIGVVGASGAGKSTLGDVILGLLVPVRGTIVVNGRPARLDTEAWWHTVGFVPQTVFLSNDTLVRNIAFGVPDARIDRARVARAASLAQLDGLIGQLPGGLDAKIGDYGVRLSGGQRQRVAIARALYHERQFLVLDEATSALDSETETAIVQAVGSLRGKVTTFIIAHRRSTLEGCDRVVEIRDGRLSAAAQR